MIVRVIRSLSNLKFAIINLLSIALFSIIGTILEQEKSIDFYKNHYPISNGIGQIINWRTIKSFFLDQIYSSIWFNILILIFALSLICCTLTQQYPSLKFFSRCRLFKSPKQFTKLGKKEKPRAKNFGNFIFNLRNREYCVFQKSNSFYCYKGLIGRISPIIVHISLILILFGALQGTFQGYTAQELVPKTEIFHIQNLIKKGKLSNLDYVNLRINDFWIQYSEDRNIRQFYSNISVLNSLGNETKRTTISVNDPLKYRDVTIYQTDWNIIGIRISLLDKLANEKVIQLPLIKKTIKGAEYWITWLKSDETEFSLLLDSLDGSILVYNNSGKLLQYLNPNQLYKINNVEKFAILEVITGTGLQIKTDPGIPTLYFGFALLIISTLLSYLSFSQFWLSSFETSFIFGGKTNRSKIQIKKEFNSLSSEFNKV